LQHRTAHNDFEFSLKQLKVFFPVATVLYFSGGFLRKFDRAEKFSWQHSAGWLKEKNDLHLTG